MNLAIAIIFVFYFSSAAFADSWTQWTAWTVRTFLIAAFIISIKGGSKIVLINDRRFILRNELFVCRLQFKFESKFNEFLFMHLCSLETVCPSFSPALELAEPESRVAHGPARGSRQIRHSALDRIEWSNCVICNHALERA